ncbi:MAG: PH domain-containing protein [Chloroflexota bacterium]
MNDKFIQSMLGENERIMLTTRQHWFVLFSAILLEIVVTLGVVVAISIAAGNNPQMGYAFVLIFIPLASMLHDIMVWKNREYIVTNRRVIQFSGVINKNVVDSSLEKVNDVRMSQSFFGRIFDYGDVEIMTASELGVNTFKRIGDPVKFKTAMLNAKENLGYEGLGSRTAHAERPAQHAENIPAMIAELDELRKKGIVTEQEFQSKKQELLAKM